MTEEEKLAASEGLDLEAAVNYFGGQVMLIDPINLEDGTEAFLLSGRLGEYICSVDEYWQIKHLYAHSI